MDSLTKMFSLAGKTAVVTGGTRGIGAAMAIALAEAGADIILVQRDESNRKTHDQIQQRGRKVTITTADLTNQEAVSKLIPDLVKAGHDMHILVTCAGIQKRHPAHQFPLDDWNAVLQVNLTTVFTLCRDFGAYLLSKPVPASGARGAIINVASLLTFQGGFTVPAYAASKGGVAQLTKALSNEWAKEGINVNAIAPGYIETDMNEALIANETRARQILERIPAARWGTPEDFKGAVVFLASEASRYVSGEVLTIDGGWMGR
ncbi:2-deoxy-D-gluconate 3-dehydrogenase [Cladophialophora yegresii CBS 114405]|uniref:2-deoxy-D-gluconate 3-dehydrogenase n=1 Tax=Cladophialophora yegresii CBS 114405 TaxID=1182544 RepID=W9W1H8_9EURO|nr:2-deoxy-D-gluconate 3-dehydrogenase [Cladophialophora yegresii CBS 114405]EXJ61927.1 2-deoxy-D-gluconate 3-dehydrogenase [Cladophialophora yegresii CBS 114405]